MLHSPVRTICCLIGIGFLLLLVAGCEGEGTEEASKWTVEEGALTLEQNLFAGDDEEYYFGRVSDVAVRDDGRIYVVDGEASHVKVLNSEGNLVDSIGREGEGPGEFQRASEVALARGDSIYVRDGSGRVSVFSPGGDFKYRFLARGERIMARNMMVPEQEREFIFTYNPPLRMRVKYDVQIAVRPGWRSGEAGDTLFIARPPELVSRDLKGSRIRYFGVPFGRRSFFALGPKERIHHVWSDSLRVTVYDQRGVDQDIVEIPFEPVLVTEEEREEALRIHSGKDRAVIQKRIPNTKPALNQFFVDDEGRYWFGRPTANPDSTDWWVAWPEEKRVVTATLPSEVQLEVVKDGRAYGQTTTENGAPALVRYRVRVNP